MNSESGLNFTSNVTLAAAAGICSPAGVSGMVSEVTPPVSVSESGEMFESSVSPVHWQARRPNGLTVRPAPTMYDSSNVCPTSTVLFTNLL